MPVYRESGSLEAVIDDVLGASRDMDVETELILVDDGSPDKTWEIVERLASSHREIRAARLSRNFGKESAVAAGLELALGDAVIVMDADGQHPPALLPEMINAWRAGGVDIVEGVKIDRGSETLFSKAGAELFYLIWTRLSGFEMRGASDYKLLSRRVLDAYLEMGERAVFFRGMTAWLGFTRVQIPFEVPERASGESSWSVMRRLRLAVNGISAFSSFPLHLVTLAGIIFFLFSLTFGGYTLILQITGRSVSGFATVILLLLVIGSLLMISLGIIGIYLARIYDELKGRPRYIIAKVLGAAEVVPISNKNV
ncbi:MAG: glycosyltransferase family 2 protein [Pyrinomonadaceae bacterium]